MAKKKKFSVGGLGGEGTTGALFKGDKLGEALDGANPYLDDSATKADAILKENKARWEALGLPNLDEIDLENPNWLGDLEAENIAGVDDVEWDDVKTEVVDGTAFDDISSDPRLRDEQMASLGALKELADNGGMNAQDQANLARIQSQAGQADRGRREAILQNAAQRGMGGSGMEMLAQLDSSQAATDRQSQEGLDVAGMAQARALEAMMQGGNMAGNIRGQDWSEEAQRAAARDAINTFNTGNINTGNFANADGNFGASTFNAGKELDKQKFNANANNTAAGVNHAGRQEIANMGVATNNSETMYNKTALPQQQFDNETTKINGINGTTGALAASELGRGDAKRENMGNMIGGVGTIVGGMGGGGKKKPKAGAATTTSDERSKKDIKDISSMDFEAFLASLQPKKFKYKDSADGEGERAGVMAQDLLKSDIGSSAVVDQGEGKLGYDSEKMQGVILGALKHLSDKIDRKG